MVGVHNAYHGDGIILSDDHGKTYNSSLGMLMPPHAMHAHHAPPHHATPHRTTPHLVPSRYAVLHALQRPVCHSTVRLRGIHMRGDRVCCDVLRCVATSINRALHRGHRRRLRCAASKRLAGCHHAQLHARCATRSSTATMATNMVTCQLVAMTSQLVGRRKALHVVGDASARGRRKALHVVGE